MSTIVADVTYQSKFGFHAVSKETYDKLRFLNRVYAKSQHLASAWQRWYNKHPDNRVLKRTIRGANNGFKIGTEVILDAENKPIPWLEPKLCPLFHNKLEFVKYGFPVSKIEDLGFGQRILAATRLVRKPQPTPQTVVQPELTEDEIDTLYQIAKSWLES